MKKRLILLPLLAGFMLTGCEVFGIELPFGEKSSQNEKVTPKKDEEMVQHNPPVLLEEFEGYTLAKEIKDGGKYLLGVYRHEQDFIRFFNGDFHRDDEIEPYYFPFYMGTTDEDSLEGAVEVEIHFLNDEEFSIQVHAEGKPWDNKYIGVYSALSSRTNPVMSIALLDSPEQTEYYVPKIDGTPSSQKTDPTNGKFKFVTTNGEDGVYSPTAYYKNERADDEVAVRKFIGTAGEYTSMDCKSEPLALDGASYDLAHFYELAE